ncbi:putative HAD superfamily hydrolase [Geobacillus sp. C56-T2]|nr:putative HAD superfamily hydrolase [Geobacillus sp. C56-T2]
MNLDQLWLSDKYLKSISSIENEVKLLSLDIFDTLIFRSCAKPVDIFLKVGEKAQKEGLSKYTPFEFQQLRILAEKVAREEKKKSINSTEVSLEQIYEHMPFDINTSNRIKEIELETEIESCYVNPSIYSLIKYFSSKNIPIVLMSDMYLSNEQIKKILINNGFEMNYISNILVSNIEGGSKEEGFLFKILMNLFPDIEKQAILHIGDNYMADVVAAKAAGIRTIHYKVIPSTINDVFSFEQVRFGDLLPELLSLRKLAGNIQNYSADEEFWFRFGATVLGPFLSIFADWIIDLCIKENKKYIYPLMREGHLLSEVISKALVYRKEQLIVRPLYVSRKATFYSFIEHIDTKFFEQLFKGKNDFVRLRNVTVYNFFEMFGITNLDVIKEFSQYYDELIENSNNVMITKETSLQEKLLQMLSNEIIIEQIKLYVEQKQRYIEEFLLQTIRDPSSSVTVDIGFRGTTQFFIDKALSRYTSGLTHVIAMGTQSTTEKMLLGLDIRGFLGNAGENIDIIYSIKRSPEIFEQLLMGEEGSTIGYLRDQSGKIDPIIANSMYQPKEIHWKKICAEGVKTFQFLWYHLINIKPQLKNEVFKRKREIAKILTRVIEMPTMEEAINLGELSHEDNFGSQYVRKICNDSDINLLDKLGVNTYISFTSHGWEYGKSYWPQGVVTRKYPFYLYSYYLKQRNHGSYVIVFNEMISRVREMGYREIAIYGAGEAGRHLLKLAILHGMNVKCFIDSNKKLWGKRIEGILVKSLKEAFDDGINVFVVGSLAYYKEIKNTIIDTYSRKNKIPKVFTAYSLEE